MVQILVKDKWIPQPLEAWRSWQPKSELGKIVRECFKFLPPELAGELLERITSCAVIESSLAVRIFRLCPDCGEHPGPNHLGLFVNSCRCPGWARLIEDYGIVSHKVVTTAGVNFLVDAWQNILELEIMKYHGIGTSSAAEAVGDTGLTTELTTQYNPDSTRATGTLTEGASANIFKTVGTNTVDAIVSIEEHGILSQAATGGGTLWDRSLTGTKSLASGEGLESTYQLTVNSGG